MNQAVLNEDFVQKNLAGSEIRTHDHTDPCEEPVPQAPGDLKVVAS